MTKASKLKKYLITHWEIWDMKSHYQPPQVDLSELKRFRDEIPISEDW